LVHLEPAMTNPQYLVKHDGQIQGPFELPFIEAMILAGVYPAAVLIKGLQAEVFAPMPQEEAHKGDKPKRPTPTDAPPAKAATASSADVVFDGYGWNGSWSYGVGPKRSTDYRPKGAAAPSSAAAGLRNSGLSKPMGWETKLDWFMSVMIVLFVIAVIFNYPETGPSKRRAGGADPPQRESLVQANRETEQRASPSSTVTTFNPPPPVATLPPPDAVSILPPPILEDDTTLYRDASGRTYRVPNSDYSRLLSMKAGLDAQAPGIDRKKAEISSQAAEIDRNRLSLNRRNQSSVDLFNQKVNRLNDANTQLQSDIDSYNLAVESFNDELARVGTLIR
jgi:hypothetical protein